MQSIKEQLVTFLKRILPSYSEIHRNIYWHIVNEFLEGSYEFNEVELEKLKEISEENIKFKKIIEDIIKFNEEFINEVRILEDERNKLLGMISRNTYITKLENEIELIYNHEYDKLYDKYVRKLESYIKENFILFMELIQILVQKAKNYNKSSKE